MSLLNEFTKKEIIFWLESDIHYHFKPPKKSDLLFIRWQVRTKEIEKKYGKSAEMYNNLTEKNVMNLYKQFNSETDWEKRKGIAKKIEMYEKQL